MYEITVETGFSAAHQLRNYHGECENLHGHNWKVRITVSAAQLDDAGIAVDFRELKAAANEIAGKFDHKSLCELPCFKNDNPTTENIARTIFEMLEDKLESRAARVKEVSVGESDTSWAKYRK